MTEGSIAFLTGATGFIGGRLAATLHARGYRLRCLVRRPERADRLQQLGAELLVGDAADVGVVMRGLAGADVAIHAAGSYDLGVFDRSAMRRVNVDAVRTFIDALRQVPVPRAVHVSTVIALGPVASGEGDESSEPAGPQRTEYARTKTEAHGIARAAQAEGLPLVIVCPALVYGPGDEGPSGRYIMDILRHRIPGLSTRSTWFSWVHVDDVVDGIIAAAERGRDGAVYVLSGEHLDVNRLTKQVAQLADTWVSPLRFPPFLIRWTGVLLDAVSRATGVRLPISAELVEQAGRGDRWLHSHARASAELGYSPRPLAEGLPETVRWAQSQTRR